MAKILLSPLGRSPGAVSGLYHALDESSVSIDRLVVLATSDLAVQASAEELHYHFHDKPTGFLTVQEISSGDDPEMVGERAVYGFIPRVNAVLYNARHVEDEVHIGIAGGRKSMSALATLSAYVYGAAAVYHFWVHERIEEWGDVYAEQFQGKKREWVMHPSRFQPSEFGELGERSCELVPIPLAPFDELWDDKDRLSNMLAGNPQARQALLRSVSEREKQEIKALRAQNLTLEEAIQHARKVFEMTNGEWLVDAALKISATEEGKVNYEIELKPYIPDPSIRTQIAREFRKAKTFAGVIDKFLAYVMGILTGIVVPIITR